MQPDTSPNPAEADIRHALSQLARQYPEASGPELVLMLARRYIRPRLRKRERDA